MSESASSPAPCGHDHADGSACASSPNEHPHAHAEENSPEERLFFTLETLALAVWGGVLVWYVASGKVAAFLSTTGIFREQALFGGLALVVLATFNFLLRKRFPGCGHDHSEDGGHDHHHHEAGGWVSRLITLFILLAPVSLAAAFAPADWTEQFKSTQANSRMAANAPKAGNAAAAQMKTKTDTAAGTQGFSLEDFKKYCPPNEAGQFVLSVSNLWSAAGDPDLRRVLRGQVAQVSAQVVVDSFSKGANRLRVFELQMTCCSADARPVSFPIEFDGPIPDFRESGWYQVTGTLDFQEERSGLITVLKVTEMKATAKPRQEGGPAI